MRQYLILLNLIRKIIFGQEYKLRSSSLRNFISNPFHLDPLQIQIESMSRRLDGEGLAKKRLLMEGEMLGDPNEKRPTNDTARNASSQHNH